MVVRPSYLYNGKSYAHISILKLPWWAIIAKNLFIHVTEIYYPTQSPTHPLARSLTHTLSCPHSLFHALARSLTPSFTPLSHLTPLTSFTPLTSHSHTRSHLHSLLLVPALTLSHALTHSLMHSLMHFFTLFPSLPLSPHAHNQPPTHSSSHS